MKAPRNVCLFILEACECAHLNCKRESADVIELNAPDGRLLWVVQVGSKGNHRCSCMREAEGDLSTDEETCRQSNMKRGHEPRYAGKLSIFHGKGKEMDSP